MAPLVTHVVIGECVFAQTQRFDPTPSVYGAFLLGCVLVDVNGFAEIDRHTTHFVGRLEDVGENAFKSSCINFLSQRDVTLRSPWNELTQAEQAFAAGYLCHLAADEAWNEIGWKVLQAMGLTSYTEMPVPGEVLLTVYDALSRQVCKDWPTVERALNSAAIPNVMTHVLYPVFQQMWELVKPHVLAGGTAQAYFDLLDRMGTPVMEIQEIRCQHEVCWDEAVVFIGNNMGSVGQYLAAVVERSASVLPQLWTGPM